MPARIPGLQAKFGSPDGVLPVSLGLNPFALSHHRKGSTRVGHFFHSGIHGLLTELYFPPHSVTPIFSREPEIPVFSTEYEAGMVSDLAQTNGTRLANFKEWVVAGPAKSEEVAWFPRCRAEFW
jgi:hypothetical protein